MEQKLRMAVISGASYALRYKDKNPHATEQEILKEVSKEARKIAAEIDDEFD